MTHFAVVAPPFYSHYKALQALAGELLERGHRVTFMHQADARGWLDDPRIGFVALGASSHPPGSLAALLRLAAQPGGVRGLHRLIGELANTTAMLCAELPAALAALQIDALLCDQMEAAGGLVATALGLPFISVACALPIDREPGLPLPVMPFAYGTRPFDLQLYQGSTRVHDWLMQPLRRQLHLACRQLGVAPRDGLHDCLSPLATISQTIAGFDFPRRQPPVNWHEVGPLRGESTASQALPVPVESGRPLVFASLGTLQGGRLDMFLRMAQACRQLDTQLLVAHCGGLDSAQEQRVRAAGASWVGDFAAQQAVLARADALITHGGLNTVMDAIASATPMLVLPIAFDQAGVAARVSYQRIGLRLSRRARPRALMQGLLALRELPGEPLQRLAAVLQQAGGVRRAAGVIEASLRPAGAAQERSA